MSLWLSVLVPILTGLLAFAGALAGHFISFDLNAAAKRREVLRAQIEKFAELLSEDIAWINNFRIDRLYGDASASGWGAPYDQAYAIFMLYFQDVLTPTLKELIPARHALEAAILAAVKERYENAIRDNRTNLKGIAASDAAYDAVTAAYGPYYQSVLNCLSVASAVALGTIPSDSQMGVWWKALRERIKLIERSK